MAVYRESSRRRLPLIILIAVIAVAIVVVGMLALLNRPIADPAAALRAKTLEVAQGLDILSVEYPKLLKGEPSGATGAFGKAKATFAAIQPDLAKIDASAVNQI